MGKGLLRDSKLIKENYSYVTPTDREISQKLEERKFEGDVNIETVKNIAVAFSYQQMGLNVEEALTPPSDWSYETEEDMEVLRNEQEFYKNLDYDTYEGRTPLDKAISVAMSTDTNCSKCKKAKLARKLNRRTRDILNITPFEKKALGLEGENTQEMVRNMTKEQGIILAVGNLMRQYAQTKTGAKVTRTPDERGKKHIIKLMDSHAQIAKVAKSQLMMPNFDERFIKKELNITQKVTEGKHKQILYMLVDTSGSMDDRIKIATVNAVLLNRLTAVAKGDAELYFSFYESNKYDEHHIKTEEHALQFYHKVKTHTYNEGGTNIGGVLEQTIQRIEELPGVKPQIMIVCDGQDFVNPDLNTGRTVVNGVIIGADNPNLKTVCKRSRGMFLDVPWNTSDYKDFENAISGNK